MGFLLSFNCQYYCMAAPLGTRWELHKNAMFYSKQILEATSDKIATVWPLVFHFTNHLSKINKTCEALLEK